MLHGTVLAFLTGYCCCVLQYCCCVLQRTVLAFLTGYCCCVLQGTVVAFLTVYLLLLCVAGYVTNMHKSDNALILIHCPETLANVTMMSE